MKYYKIFRTGSLILGLWFLVSAVYVILSGFEKFDCCAMDVEGYGAYTLTQWLIDAKNEPLLGACLCDGKNLPTTVRIIPVDLIAGTALFLGVFGYLQIKTVSKE